MEQPKDVLRFRIIDCVDYIYIQKGDGKYNSSIYGLLFDGELPQDTFKSDWYKLDKVPTSITQSKPKLRQNERWELKEGYSSSELMPKLISRDEYDSDQYEEIINCYKYLYDEVDDGFEEVEFTIDKIYEKKDFEFISNDYGATVSSLTQIEYPSDIHQEMPCKLNSVQMMKIIKEHVKKNIDRNYATITSDYDFHFEVKKQIGLYEPYNQLVDTNNAWMNKRRKPKWVERIVSSKSEVILNMKDGTSPTDYGKDCVVAPTIIGENYADLKVKVNKYLDELTAIINTPYCECPHCQGWGIIKEEDLKNEEI